MARFGFNFKVPQTWSKLWLIMWFLTTAALVVLAFLIPFWPTWLLASAALFFVPEIISILRRNDAYPPLTHTIRHFLPNWVAFPLIYFLLGAIGAQWLEFPRPLHLGGLFALLGWLTDHFAVTYSKPDPFPFSKATEVVLDPAEPRGLTL